MTGAAFLLGGVIAVLLLIWWLPNGRATIEKRVLLDVRRSMENSRGWRSLSIFAHGGFAQADEQRRLEARLWRVVTVLMVLLVIGLLTAAGVAFTR